MKKRIVVWAVAILLVLVVLWIIYFWIIIYFGMIFKNLNACKDAKSFDETQNCCNSLAQKYNWETIKCIGSWEIQNKRCEFKCGAPSEIPPMPKILTKECENATENKVQDCCENWAKENDIVRAECVGNWKVEYGWCMWKCI